MKLVEKISMETLVSQKENIDASELDGEKVMMNFEKGKYFVMNDIGSRIWDILNTPTSVNKIVLILLSEYDVDQETCEKTVIEFLERVYDEELINVN